MMATQEVEYLRTDDKLPPVGVREQRRVMSTREKIVLGVVALASAVAWSMLAVVRGENVNAVWFVVAALGSYYLGYRYYAKFIERKLVQPNDKRATPAEEFDNGKDFMPTDRRVLFGHHFAAIAGAGPLVGPVLAAQMGYLPGVLWIVIGVILAGAVQDYLVLHLSIRRRGRSIGQIAKDELGPVGGWVAIVGIFLIMIMLLAVLGIVVIGAMAESPWAVFSVSMTIPIALFMGVYLRYMRPGRVSEVSLIGVVLLLAAVIGGNWVSHTGWGAAMFTRSKEELAIGLCIYGFAAAVLPVWLLLAPRDYLSTFMKVGTIVLLAAGIVVTAPTVQMPAVTEFAANGKGPAFAGNLFPFLFITIACGALSGFHSLVSSGTTPKLIEKESQARVIGYGGMLVESSVAVMALVAACTIDQNIYYVMNAPAAATGGTAEGAVNFVTKLNLHTPGGQPLAPPTADQITGMAKELGENSIVSRTGGAPTLAVGIAEILGVFGAKSFWYHFAIMFEALFILTTVDAGTRVARFMLSDALSNVTGLGKFRDTSWTLGAWICTAIVVAGWGSILYMGVTDPLGGIYVLFPLFGIANQLLAAMALSVVFVVVVKQGKAKWAWIPGVPLVWDLIVTMSASYQKIFSDIPAIGFYARRDQVQQALSSADPAGSLKKLGIKSVDDANTIVTNAGIQGALSIVYAVLVLLFVAICAQVAWKAWRNGGAECSEAEAVPSKIFAPTGLIATAAERDVEKQWVEQVGRVPVRSHH